MSMRYPQIFHLLAVFISSTVLCSATFGEPFPNPQISQGAQMTQQSQWIEAGEEPVSLQETLERTYMQNTDLDAARAGLRSTDEEVPQAVSGWRPSINVEGQQTQGQAYPIGRPSRQAGVKGHGSRTAYTASITQNIYKGGQTEAQVGIAQSDVLSGRAGLFVQEQNSLFTGVQAHTDILANEAIVEYQKQNRDFYLKLLQAAEAFFDVGQGGRVAVEEARGKYEQGIADVATAIGSYESSKATYMQTTGSPPGKLAPANIIMQLPNTYEEALEIAKTHNPSITQARYALEAAEYTVYRELGKLLPSVDVQGQVGNSRLGGNNGITSGLNEGKPLKRTDLTFNTIVNVPIYPDGGAQSSAVRQAYQKVAQAKVSLVGTQRAVVQAVREAWESLIAAREAVKGFLAQVKATQLAVEGAFEEVKVGQTSITDMIVIQQNLLQAQISLATKQKALVDAGYQLLAAMGRLTARDLRLNVRYYDPDAYYNEYKDAWIQFWQGEDWRYVKDGDTR